ncbi:MAG TPA: hypothetical protein VKA68_14770, partial [bacterium]|nr:hypothetical protein [bacterium]
VSQEFFQHLLRWASAVIGQEFVESFVDLKRQREQFLRDQWAGIESRDITAIFREVDYEYLITSLHKNITTEETLVDLQFQLAEICLQFSELQRAHDLLTQTRLHLLEGVRDQQLGKLHLMLGRVEANRNQWMNARRWLEDGLYIYSTLNDTQGMASAHVDLGILNAQQWSTTPALSHFEKAKELLRWNLNSPLGLKIQNNLAIIQCIHGGAEEAVRQFEKLLCHHYADKKDHKVYLQINYGLAVKETADLDRAKTILNKAVQAANVLPNTRLIALASLALAEVHIRQESYEAGVEYLIDSFKIFSKEHDRATLADSYRMFGMLHRETMHPQLAAANFDISLRLNNESGNLLNLSETCYEYSLLAEQEHDKHKQIEYLQESLSHAQAMGATPRIKKLEQAIAAV